MPLIRPRPDHDPGAGRRSQARRTRCAALLLAAAALVPLAQTAPAVAAGTTNSDAFQSLGSSSQPDWMSRVPDHAWLAAVSIPGTHESLAIHGGQYVQAQEDFGDSAQTLAAQYDAGIRAVDIRVRVIGGKFAIHHGPYYQNANFDDVLTKTQAFLTAHPGETILMRLHSECVGGVTSCTDDPSSTTDADRMRIFQQYVAAYPGLFYAPSVTGTTTVPQLSQVRGKIVLLGFESPHGGSYGLGVNGYNANTEDAYSTAEPVLKWPLVKANLDKAAADSTGSMFGTYTSANGLGTLDALDPGRVAGGYWYRSGTGAGSIIDVEGVNKYLMDYLNHGGDAGGHIGVVMMDFPGWAPIADIIAHNPTYKPASAAIWQVNSDGTYVDSRYGRCMSRGPATDSSGSGGLVVDRVCQNPVPGSQRWTATNPSAYFDGKGYFWIKSGDGKCLTAPYNNGVAPPAGTQLLWWPCETRWFSGNQMWNVIPTQLKSSPAYQFANQWTGLCLTADPATSTQPTGKVTQDACPK